MSSSQASRMLLAPPASLPRAPVLVGMSETQLILSAAPGITAGRYLSAVGLAALLCDHIDTLPQEIELIWTRPFSRAKLAFLFIRYGVAVGQLSTLYTLSGLFRHVTNGVTAQTGLSSSAWILRALLAAYAVSAIATLVTGVLIVRVMRRTARFNDIFHTCTFPEKPKVWPAFWATQLGFDFFALVLTFLNAADRPRQATVKLITELRRDGGLWSLAMTAFRVLSLVLSIPTGVSLYTMTYTFGWSISAISVCRLLLGYENVIQSAGEPEMGYELEVTVHKVSL
ncbi:hypothetical protein FA95DRAFT_343761 [Auriscalpium vulgare]|uniref:Uncharacterized protein n=1 Tax=Auriscalpium vulgare TaxID=40419 RepID=A0ACB8RIU6_9AGAM|nr:hypothetical protein FA95DRAFT_343761 [Auriscalpium vulgare]